jgi:hypothetical protein
MEYNRIEKMVHEYLDSIVGGNPVLTKHKVLDRYWSNKYPVENFYVNGVRVGSIRIKDCGLLIETKIRNTLMKLFDLNMEDSYLYFRKWINKLERDDR